jgi:hypothetical protein
MAQPTIFNLEQTFEETVSKQTYIQEKQTRCNKARKMLKKYMKGTKEDILDVLVNNPHFLFYTDYYNRNILHYAIFKFDGEFIIFLVQFARQVLSYNLYNKWIRMKAYDNSYYSYPIKMYNFEIVSILLRYIPLNDYIVIDVIRNSNFDYNKTLLLLEYISDFINSQECSFMSCKESILNCAGVFISLDKRLCYFESDDEFIDLYRNFRNKIYYILTYRKLEKYNPEKYFVLPNLLNCHNSCNIYERDLTALLDILSKNVFNFDLGTKYNNEIMVKEPLGWLQYILANISKTKILTIYENYEIYLKKNLAKIYYLYFLEKIKSKKLIQLLQIDYKLIQLKQEIFDFYTVYPKYTRESMQIRDPLSILTYSYLKLLPFLEYLKTEKRIQKIFNNEDIILSILEFL